MSGHTSSPTHVARIALAAAVIGSSALATAVQASAEPVVPPLPPPVLPAEAPAPGQPVLEVPGIEPVAAPAPPPVGPPPVPEIRNPQYGSGNSSGPLGFLRDAWNQAKDPYGFNETPLGQMPGGAPPPPGAGPAPQLPPGYTSLNAPESNGPASGADGRRAASAGGVLPAGRATAARVLRRASRPGYATGDGSRFRLRRCRSGAVYASAGMTFCSNISIPERS